MWVDVVGDVGDAVGSCGVKKGIVCGLADGVCDGGVVVEGDVSGVRVMVVDAGGAGGKCWVVRHPSWEDVGDGGGEVCGVVVVNGGACVGRL